ncbi:hypothetical protein [Pelagicoccus sp. SDUM812005]|uniref:hypothetical protein n=1 Tax=Pelagicoccus sp. SDUM812005 TaxID=3041257 RepID=UPI00280FB2F6|nr:hypothetical protein [Pelagicoccus sp. SDUM812005]MDQ8181850.1 hypothetical protein [Pelagicoccus sp. SDUM812005]
MSEMNEREEEQIVDLDTCPKKKSILIAAAITAVLGFVGYSYLFLCIHYIIGGFAAAGGFAKRHSISISAGTGAKLGAVSSFLGMLVAFTVFAIVFYNGFAEADFETAREEILRKFYEDGQPEAAEFAENLTLEQVRPLVVGVMLAAGSALSLILGALGGVIGASVFKRGPQAR